MGLDGRQVVSSTERVLAVVDGISQLLQHHLQGGVLRQFDHEHAGLHTDVARIWLTLKDKNQGNVSLFMLLRIPNKLFSIQEHRNSAKLPHYMLE